MPALFLALVLLLAPLGAGRAMGTCDLPLGQTATALSAIDGETLQLSDGGQLRLLGVVAPAPPPPWWTKPDPWPPAQAAREALERAAAGRTLSLHFDGPRRDRHGRLRAQVFIGEGERRLWLQGHMIASGHARAYAFAEARACAGALLEREASARASRKGLWANSAYRVMDAARPEELLKRLQRFVIVEGRITKVGRAQRWRFLNFGADWKRDFTVAVASGDQKTFQDAGLDLGDMAGAKVRVRGWIERWNGPAIKLTHPGQIEVLEPASPGDG